MYEMIDMHSKYDNMHMNGMSYALIYINNHIITCINCMLSVGFDWVLKLEFLFFI